jgi:peptidoglycan/xylan/chitin deacetylase (PgdA/CDA1 family)
MYHRVAAVEPDVHRLALSPALFERQIDALLARFQPLPLEQILEADSAFAVTFDDGTADALVAADILDRRSLPATFFINSARLGELHEPWWDTLERLFFDGSPLPDELLLEGRRFDTLDRAATHDALNPILRHSPRPQALLDEIVAWSGRELLPRPTHRCLTAEEIRSLASRHAIGAHGAQHLFLPSLTAEAQEREIADCRAALGGLLDAPPALFAYAFGAWDETSLSLVRRLGFSHGVTVEPRAVRAGDEPLRLPRVDPRGLAPDELADFVASLMQA